MNVKCLSIRQPWASLILEHGKDVENRTWRTHYRGPLAIHAGAQFDPGWRSVETIAFLRERGLSIEDIVALESAPRGGVLGVVELVAVTFAEREPSPWAMPGQQHWEVMRPRKVPFVPMKGRLGFFDVEIAHG